MVTRSPRDPGDDSPVPEHFESESASRDDELGDQLSLDRVGAPEPSGDARPIDLTKPEPVEPDTPPVVAEQPTSPAGGRWWRRGTSRPARRKAPWWELPLLIVIAIAVAMLIKTFVIQPFYIPSQSMETTLHGCPGCSGDRILVNKPIYDLRDPHPGDIVVFKAPSPIWYNDAPATAKPGNPIVRGVRWFGQLVGLVPPDEHDLVKRVIAVGGQTVRGQPDGTVQISTNGDAGPWRTLNEPYVSSQLSGTAAVFGPVTIPKGRLWVMGDNRANSDDSRFHNVVDKLSVTESTVPNGDVIGKAVLIAWPPSRWRTLGTPSTFKQAAAATAAPAPLAGAAAFAVPLFVLRRRRRR